MKDPAAEVRRQLDDLASTIPRSWADDVNDAAADGLDASRYPAPLTAHPAQAAERAAVVAWLRTEADSADPESATWSPYRAADAIERGEHLTGGEGGR